MRRQFRSHYSFFFFNDTATTEIYTLSLHDALPIWPNSASVAGSGTGAPGTKLALNQASSLPIQPMDQALEVRSEKLVPRSEEHTSELQSRQYLVCRLLLEKKKKYNT